MGRKFKFIEQQSGHGPPSATERQVTGALPPESSQRPKVGRGRLPAPDSSIARRADPPTPKSTRPPVSARQRVASPDKSAKSAESIRTWPPARRLIHETIRRVIDMLLCALIETTSANIVRRIVRDKKRFPRTPVGVADHPRNDRSPWDQRASTANSRRQGGAPGCSSGVQVVPRAYSAGQSLMYALSSLFSRLRSSSTALATSWKDTMPTTLASSITGT